MVDVEWQKGKLPGAESALETGPKAESIGASAQVGTHAEGLCTLCTPIGSCTELNLQSALAVMPVTMVCLFWPCKDHSTSFSERFDTAFPYRA